MVGFSQNSKKNVAKDFNSYMETLVNKEFAKTVEYHPEFVFQSTSKKQMIQGLEKTYNNPAFTFKIDSYAIDKIGRAYKSDSLFYRVIKYQVNMNKKLNSLDKKSAKDKEAFLRILEMQLLSQYGFGNVTLNKKTDFFKIKEKSKVCAISKDGIKDWKFIVLNYEQRESLKLLLPKKLHKEL